MSTPLHVSRRRFAAASRPAGSLAFLMLAACLIAPLSTAHAVQSFRVHIDDSTEIVREVQAFEVVEVGEGYALMRLDPFQREVAGALLQLGEKKTFGETPIPGEALWLAYDSTSKLGVARLTSTQSPDQIPAGATVLSIRPDPNPVPPVDGALEAARAFKKFGRPESAKALLEHYAGLSEFKPQQCRILGALFDVQTPETPDGDRPLPEGSESTFRTLLAECSGAALETPVQRFVQWTLARLEAQRATGKEYATQRRLLRDALDLLKDNPAADRLLVALARVLEREGDAEEGSKVLEDFFRRFPASPHRDDARVLQEALARRAPARSHRNAGHLGSPKVTASLGLRTITDLAFDPQGRLVVLDGKSKPRQIVLLDLSDKTMTSGRTIAIEQKWDPIALDVAPDGRIHLIETNRTQLVSVMAPNALDTETIFPQRGDAWRLRRPQRLCVVDAATVLVLDTSSRQVFHFDIASREMTRSIDLRALDLANALDIASAPDGQAALATPDSFVVFNPEGNPGAARKAMRGHTVQLKIDRIDMDRWKYVYVFDRDSARLEKFRRGGEWLTTVIDCAKEGIRRPGVWAVSPEGDVVLHDESTDRFFHFVQ